MAARQALVWPPRFDEHNTRVKGFFPYLLKEEQIATFLKETDHLRSLHPTASRICIRFIAPKSHLSLLTLSDFTVEASFPIAHIFSDCVVGYFSYVNPDRNAVTSTERSIQSLIEKHSPADQSALERKLRAYQISRFESIDSPLAGSISALYGSRFEAYPVDFTPNAIQEMPKDHEIMLAFQGEKLVATFMADRASINIDDKILTFFDFVNVVSTARGIDLIPLMAQRVIEIAHTQYANPIVFAEARSDIDGLQVCCIRAGLKYAGRLAASSLFQDSGEKSPSFRDTIVWFNPFGSTQPS